MLGFISNFSVHLCCTVAYQKCATWHLFSYCFFLFFQINHAILALIERHITRMAIKILRISGARRITQCQCNRIFIYLFVRLTQRFSNKSKSWPIRFDFPDLFAKYLECLMPRGRLRIARDRETIEKPDSYLSQFFSWLCRRAVWCFDRTRWTTWRCRDSRCRTMNSARTDCCSNRRCLRRSCSFLARSASCRAATGVASQSRRRCCNCRNCLLCIPSTTRRSCPVSECWCPPLCRGCCKNVQHQVEINLELSNSQSDGFFSRL